LKGYSKKEEADRACKAVPEEFKDSGKFLVYYLNVYYYYHGSTALCLALAAFQFLDPMQNR
jgi:hypothetical protein